MPSQAPNFQYIQATNEELNAWVKEKTGLRFELNSNNGYKVNDLKAMYGHLFADVIGKSQWWGYYDLDVVSKRYAMHMTIA